MKINFYKNIKVMLLVLVATLLANASFAQALSGVKTINPVGTGANNYVTFSSAIDSLNKYGVGSGGVTFNIPAGLIFNEKDSLVITATGTAANPIIFQKTGSGQNPIVAADYAGMLPVATSSNANPALAFDGHGDAVIKLVGTSYITFDGLTMRDALGKTTIKEKMEYGIYLCKTKSVSSLTAPVYPSACKFVTIKNCIFILDKNNVNSTGIFSSNKEASSKPVLSNVSATDTTANLVNIIVTNNKIQNCYHGIVFTGTVHLLPTTATSTSELTSLQKDRKFNISNNTILNYGGGASNAFGIYNNHISNATISNNFISGGAFTSGSLVGIAAIGGFNSNLNVDNNTISLSGMIGTAGTFPIQVSVGGGSTATPWAATLLSSTYYVASGLLTNTVNINNNKIINNKIDNNGSFQGITAYGMIPSILNINNNLIANNTKDGGGSIFAISINTPSRGISTNVKNNIIRDNKITSKFSTTTTNPAFQIISIGSPHTLDLLKPFNQTLTLDGNIIRNNGVEFIGQTTRAASIFGFAIFGNSTTRVIQSFSNNTIKGLYIKGNSSGTSGITGYSFTGASSSSGTVLPLPIAITRFNNNIIDSIYVNKQPESGQAATVLPGSGTITGITANTFDTLYMHNNSISNLYANGIGSTVRGLATTSGFVLQIYNNTISELYAPITRISANSSVTGMDLGTSSTSGRILVANNTVYLDNNNTDTLSKHRSAALYTATTSSNNIRLVNNIFVNKSKGNKNTFHVAHMRATSDFTSMRTAGFLSGRNVYFAGATASQSKSAFALMVGSTDTLFTLNQYQSAATPADTSSFGEDAPFVNTATAPYNLNLATTTATFAANRALPITFNTSVGVKTDFDNNSRSTTTPDIGAYEGSYTFRNSDFNPPVLSYALITTPSPMSIFTTSTTVFTLSATIVDWGSGVNTTTGTKPRLYYRIYKKNNALASNFYNTNDRTTGGWKFVEPTSITTPIGGVTNSVFNYVIDSNKLNNYLQGDSVEYFVIAQDFAATPNIATNKLTVFNTAPSSVGLTASNFPIKTLGNMFRTAAPFPATITVGAVGGAYSSFTGTGGLFDALNVASINKNLDIKVVSNTYETGVVDLTSTAFQTGTYKINISPAGATEDSIVGIGATGTGAMMEFVATKRVTIDGSFNGAGKYLIFSNPIANPGLRFTPTTLLSCDSIKIVNCVFVGTSSSSSSSYGILAVGNTATSYTLATNAKHKNIIIENNIFKRINVGVYLSNAATTAFMTGVRVVNNKFGQAEAPLRSTGVFVGYTRNAVVDTNLFEHLYQSTVTAISGSNSRLLRIRKNVITNKNVTPQTLLSSLVGITLSTCDSSKVLSNIISDNISSGTFNLGIGLNTGVTNSMIAYNQISSMGYNGTNGFGVKGMNIAVSAAAKDTIFANTISKIVSDGDGGSISWVPLAIYVQSGGGLCFYNNTVNLYGAAKPNSYSNKYSAAIAFSSTVTDVKVQNNILVNKMSFPGLNSNAFGIIWLGPASELKKLDNNVYFTDASFGSVSRMRTPAQTSGFTDFKSLGLHVLANLKDSTSYYIEPIFVDSNDCHIAATGTPVVMESKGVTFSTSLNTDIDNQVFAGPLSPKTNGGGTKWDIGADEFDGIPDNSDRVAPNLTFVSILPLPAQCSPSSHTISVLASDASGIDTVNIGYSVNNVKQSDIIMTLTSTPNIYEGVIPAQKAGATVRFKVTAMDLSVNKNKYTIGGLQVADSVFSDADFSILAITQYDTIARGSTSKLTASISDKIVGAGTLVYPYTTAANVFDRYYGGRRAQYLFTANELLAAGLRKGAITRISFETGQIAPKAIALPGFRVDMAAISSTALTTTYVTSDVVVNNIPPNGYKPIAKNGRLTIEIPPNKQLIWNGESSIVVGVLWSVGDGGTAFADTSQSFRPKYSITTNQSVIYSQADNQTQDYFINLTTGTSTNTRPNIVLGNDYIFTNNWSSLNTSNAGLPTATGALTAKTITVTPTADGTYEYVSTGVYNYTTTRSCTNKDTVTLTVLPVFRPKSDFVINDSTVNCGDNPQTVVFKDLTTNLPSRWKWDITPKTYSLANSSILNRYTFVSSTSDSSKNPEVIFNYAGEYTVRLITSNFAGADTVVKTKLIKVDSVYCIPTYVSSASAYAITKVVLKNMTKKSSAASPYYTNYADSANVVVPQLNIGVRDSIIVQGTNTFSQIAVWMDFNNNAIFESSELVDRAPIPGGTDSNILFYTVPPNAALGKVRMRVVSYYTSATPTPCSGYSGGFYGETEDYLVEILPSLQMNIVSNTAEQNTLPVSRSSFNQQVIRFTSTTSGSASTISLTKLFLNLAGTTNIADIKRIRVYSTIGSGVYATDSLFASTTTIIGNTLTLTGTNPKAFVNGQNNFWIAVDISNTATNGNIIDIAIDSITYRKPATATTILTTTVATPNGNPSGSRTVAAQMQVTNDAISQPVTITVTPGTNDNAMMLVKLTTSTGSPANIVSLKFTSTGSTNAGIDINRANVFYTGTSNAFSTNNRLGAAVTSVLDTMEFSGVQSLSPGDNYFWLSYDVKSTAVVGNVIDASYFGFITQGSYDFKTTVVANNPAGNRAIDSATCVSNSTQISTTLNDDDIASVRVGSIVRQTQNIKPVYNRADANQSYNNYTTLAPFVIQRAIKTPIEVNTINQAFTLTANRVSVYIDYNNNRKFDDNELLTSKVIPAAVNQKRMIDTVRVPISIPNGFYRMRFIVTAVTGSAQVGCGTYLTGETEDYLVQLTTPPPGDYYAPTFTNLTVTPATSQCVATPRTISVSVTDTTGIDTVWMDWKLNNQKQAPRILVKSSSNAYTNTYTTTLPAYATQQVEYSFRALDLGAPYRNNSSLAGGKYEDEYLQVNAGKDQFIKVGDTTRLTAGSKALSNLLISDIVQFKSAAAEVYPSYIGTIDDDFIEISNISNGNADISGFKLRILGTANAGTVDFTYTVPSGAIIPSGEVAVLSWATTGTDHTNRFYGMSLPTTTSSIYAMGYILSSPSGQIVDAVGTNGYSFDPAITGVASTDWSGNIPTSSNGVVRTANADNNLATDFAPSVAAGPIVTIGIFNTNLPIVPATVSVTWTGGLFVGTKTGASVSTPAHPIAGAYSYVAKIDDNTCTDRDTVVVRVLARPIVSLGVDGSICAGTRILDAGNVPFAKYLWSTGETTKTISVSSAGTYSVTVTDSARNVVRDTINLIGGPAFTAQLGANRDLCIGGNITLTPAITGATTPSCVWSTGATTMAINVSTAGTYSMIATNESGCMSFDTITVTLLQTNPVVDLGPNQTICTSSPSTLDAGNAGSTYLWSTGATTQTIAAANAGSYSVIVNTPTGCTLYDTVTIANLPGVTVSLGANKEVCPGTTTTLDAGNAGLTYLWSTGATTQTITAATGTYTVAVTNASGCVGVDTIVVTNKVAPVVSLGADQSICTSDTITLDAGNAGATYLWSTGATTKTIRVSLANTYTVAVTNAAGCTTNDAIVITNKAVPVSTFTTQVVDTTKGQQVKFTAVSAAGTSYAWNFGDPNSASNTSSLSTPTHLFSAAGNYTVTLTVTNVGTGCKSVTQIAVSVTGLANDFAKAFKLGAAPNPFAGNTKINYELPSNANVTLEVYDMIGRKVSTIANSAYQESGVHTYDFSAGDNQNASGVYMVRLIVDGQVAILRVIDIANR
jgi:hypothetical protein